MKNTVNRSRQNGRVRTKPRQDRITIITDTWRPAKNSTVTTLFHMRERLMGISNLDVDIVHPGLFRYKPLTFIPSLSSFSFDWPAMTKVCKSATRIHIATEGPLGLLARWWSILHRKPYTTSHSIDLPLMGTKLGLGWVPSKWFFRYMKWFHNRSSAIFVPTETAKHDLVNCGLPSDNIHLWDRGVDVSIFNGVSRRNIAERQSVYGIRPDQKILLYVCRMGVEDGVERFLRLDTQHLKIIACKNYHVSELTPCASEGNLVVLEFSNDADLAQYYSDADVLVYLSMEDRYGRTIVESMACGTPIAAKTQAGPKDLIDRKVTGYISVDINVAIDRCLTVDREACRAKAVERYGNNELTDNFLNTIGLGHNEFL